MKKFISKFTYPLDNLENTYTKTHEFIINNILSGRDKGSRQAVLKREDIRQETLNYYDIVNIDQGNV